MSIATQATVRARDGLRLTLSGCGEGEPLLLFLHGWASDRRCFDHLLPAVCPVGRAVALDWRGHGESDTPEGDFGTAELLADALDTIAALDAHTVVPIAHSHAGWVAFQLARALPDKVAAVVLISWMPLGAPEEFLKGVERMQQRQHTREVVSALTASWQEGHDVIGLPKLLQAMRAHDDSMWARAAREISAAFTELGSPLAAFASLDPPIPVLHVYAAPPDDAYLAAQRAYADKHPWYTVHRLANAHSHFPMLEAPEEIASAITAHLADLR